MGYADGMDARKATPVPQPEADWVEVPLNADDIAACEAAEAEVARGEWVDGEVVLARLRAMQQKYRALAARRR